MPRRRPPRSVWCRSPPARRCGRRGRQQRSDDTGDAPDDPAPEGSGDPSDDRGFRPDDYLTIRISFSLRQNVTRRAPPALRRQPVLLGRVRPAGSSRRVPPVLPAADGHRGTWAGGRGPGRVQFASCRPGGPDVRQRRSRPICSVAPLGASMVRGSARYTVKKL